MRFVSPKSKFQAHYFELLQRRKLEKSIDFNDICEVLGDKPIDVNGQRRAFQFSFITKLAHMIDSELPIVDSMVADFYFLPAIESKVLTEKVAQGNQIYRFVRREQERILAQGLLDEPISAFRAKFNPTKFTDQKIVDSLIWAFVNFAKKAAFLDGIFVHT